MTEFVFEEAEMSSEEDFQLPFDIYTQTNDPYFDLDGKSVVYDDEYHDPTGKSLVFDELYYDMVDIHDVIRDDRDWSENVDQEEDPREMEMLREDQRRFKELSESFFDHLREDSDALLDFEMNEMCGFRSG